MTQQHAIDPPAGPEAGPGIDFAAAACRLAFDTAPVGIAIGEFGTAGPEFADVNPALGTIFATDPAGLTGTELLFRLVPDDRPRVAAMLDAVGTATTDWARDHVRADVNGDIRVLQFTACAVTTDDATALRRLLTLHVVDVTDLVRTSDQLAFVATHDPLTNLAMRAEFEHRVSRLLRSTAVVRSGNGVGVIVIGLDGLADVNARFGRAIGDRVLAATARRIRAALGDGDVACRLGGDEFAAVCVAASANAALGIAHKLDVAVAQPLQCGSETVRISAGFGLAWSDDPAESPSALLRAADASLAAAKAEGRHRTVGVVLDRVG